MPGFHAIDWCLGSHGAFLVQLHLQIPQGRARRPLFFADRTCERDTHADLLPIAVASSNMRTASEPPREPREHGRDLLRVVQLRRYVHCGAGGPCPGGFVDFVQGV